MNSILKTTLTAGLAALTLSIPIAISSTPASAGSHPVSPPYYGNNRCSHTSCAPTGTVGGAPNKNGCKPNGEGCLRQK